MLTKAEFREYNRVRAAKWRRENPEKFRAIQRRYKKRHPEKVVATVKAWRKKNKAHIKAYSAVFERSPRRRAYRRAKYAANPQAGRDRAKSWRARNKLAVKVQKYAHRARKHKAPGHHTKDDLIALLKMQNHRCANPYCRCDLRRRQKALDHKRALVKGGSNYPKNLQWLCVPCNSRKSTLSMGEWQRRERMR